MKRCFIETVAKTGLFGATEYVLYRIPDNTDNRDPVYYTGSRGQCVDPSLSLNPPVYGVPVVGVVGNGG